MQAAPSEPPATTSAPVAAAAVGSQQDAGAELVIRSSTSWAPLHLRELWAYRELLYFLAWRDIKVRYKQTILGVAWAVLQPVFTMVVLSIVFGRLARVPSDGLPYPVFAFTALVPWTFFASGLSASSDSLVANAHLIKKVFFPRLLIPIAAVLGGTVDFLIALTLLFAMLPVFGLVPSWHVVWLPAFMLLALVTALGVGLWLSALNVQFRDVRHTTSFLLQAWLFCTPIAYPSSLLPEPWRSMYGLNPMAGVVEGFRWALLGTPAPGSLLGVSAAAALVVLAGGAFYFRRMERTFADRV